MKQNIQYWILSFPLNITNKSNFNEQKALSIVKTGAYIMEKSFMIIYSSLEVISLLNFNSKINILHGSPSLDHPKLSILCLWDHDLDKTMKRRTKVIHGY